MRILKDKLCKNSAFILILAATVFFSGCAPLLVAGGAVGGYAVAKQMDDDKTQRRR